jgi:hypothetical protein
VNKEPDMGKTTGQDATYILYQIIHVRWVPVATASPQVVEEDVMSRACSMNGEKRKVIGGKTRSRDH